MIKNQIDTLLKTLCDTYDDIPSELDRAACAVQDALESGAFDCLVEHPASEPPDDNRNVLVLITWRVRRMAYFEHGKWLVYGLDGLYRQEYIKSWQELPLASEVKK